MTSRSGIKETAISWSLSLWTLSGWDSTVKNTKLSAITLALMTVMVSPTSWSTTDPFAELDTAVAQSHQTHEQKLEEFYKYVNNYLDEYEQWRDDYTAQLDAEKAKHIEKWGTGDVSDQTTSVEYSDNDAVKKVIDYENNTATISVLVPADTSEEEAQKQLGNLSVDLDGDKLAMTDGQVSQQEVDYSAEQEKKEYNFIVEQTEAQMNELDNQAERLIHSNTGIPDSFIYERAYKKKMALVADAQERVKALRTLYKAKRAELGIPEPVVEPEPSPTTEPTQTAQTPKEVQQPEVKETSVAKTPTVKTNDKPAAVEPMTEQSEQIAKVPQQPVTPEATETTKPSVTDTPAKPTSKAATPKPMKVVSYTIKLPEGALKKRAEQYRPMAYSESKEFDINPALVMAIMHSESSFRPDAKSHVPAYGLMQVVPSSAGYDVNRTIRNIDAPMKADELYQPPVNVETGTAYLHILNDKYLSAIKDKKSRTFCTIAAYNTGAGNVARAFNPDHSTNIRKAAGIINSMTPDEVYQHLIENLPYDETKNYLKKVSSRMALYQ